MNLRVENVSFRYPSGVLALDGVNAEIASGEVVGILGENGAGKTTLVKLFNGLLRPSQGKVWIGDWDTADHSTAALAARVGFLFQNPDDQLFERTVAREVAYGPRNQGASEAQVKRRVAQALKLVGLQAQADSHPYDLPQPQRKLLALAATIAMQTPILVLDEPTIGQDEVGRTTIGHIVNSLHQMGRTLIIITHDVDFCAQHAQRILVMLQGKVHVDGAASEVLIQTKILDEAEVAPPQLVRLAQALKMPAAPLNVEDFVDEYKQWRKKRKK
ncbi:MAG: ABC transporter ATP-binding protein [Anaerolineales bacterium]|nr:ABC transporter ATP-binding protein [Anaerolineales bacterium]